VCEGVDGCANPVCVDGCGQFVCPGNAADPARAPREGRPHRGDCGIDSDEPERVCAPPFSDLGWGGFAADGVATNESGMAPAPRAASGSAPGASSPGDDDSPAAGGDNKAGFGDGESGMEPKADSGGSCSVSAAGATAPFSRAVSFLPVLGLCLLALRRRRR
jgi:MYXO-CTERM domain-containing protein